jgi:hypothetical protein
MDIKSVRPKAYAVLRKAGLEIAHSYPSRIRGMKNWSGGVVVVERFLQDAIHVESYYDIRASRERYVASAVTALRNAGWTVTDDGKIEALPTPVSKP